MAAPKPERLDETAMVRLLVDRVRDYAVFLLDPEGRVFTWNEGARRIKGYEAKEIIGQRGTIFYPPDNRHRFDELLAIARRDGTVEDEGWRVRKDGTRFWADVVITAVRDDNGTLVGFGKVTRDLTERRAAEEVLRQSEERTRLLLASVREYAIFMLDEDGRVATWNEGAERIKGYAPAEIIGKKASIFYPPDEAKRFDELLETARATGVAKDEGWRVRKDGSRFWADVILTKVTDAHGLVRGFAKVTRDMTDRRAAEQNALRLAQTEEALRLRDEFLSIASHELKTPLTSLQLHILGIERALQKDPDATVQSLDLDRRLKKAGDQLRRMVALIEMLLDVSRIATGRLRLQPAPADFSVILRTTVEDVRDSAERAGCNIEVHVRPGTRTKGTWDAVRVGQVLTNLIDNALKYGRGKPVAIDVSSPGDVLRVSITDHGIGFAPEHRDRIFDRFERAVSARHFGGLGLGLYISREIVHAHGGRIWAESEPHVATVFTFELPFVSDAARETT